MSTTTPIPEFHVGQTVYMTAEGRKILNPKPPIFEGTVKAVHGVELDIILKFGERAATFHKSYWRPAR